MHISDYFWEPYGAYPRFSSRNNGYNYVPNYERSFSIDNSPSRASYAKMKITERLRYWNLNYAGDENEEATDEFINRLWDFFRSFEREFCDWEILQSMTCAFSKTALDWYVKCKPRLLTWYDFRRQFETRYCDWHAQLELCKQKKGEKIADYMDRLRLLVAKIRYTWWDNEKELVDLIYKNILPEYREWLKPDREKFDTLMDVEKYAHLYEVFGTTENTKRAFKQIIDKMASQHQDETEPKKSVSQGRDSKDET